MKKNKYKASEGAAEAPITINPEPRTSTYNDPRLPLRTHGCRGCGGQTHSDSANPEVSWR